MHRWRQPDGTKTPRNVRRVFERFLDDHYRERLRSARPLGRWKGHPISHTTWVDHTHQPGVLFVGEAARMTHNATGEGIYQAMQSGVYAAEALVAAASGQAWSEVARRYTWACRRRFTASFAVGHLVRGIMRTPLLDGVAVLYNKSAIRTAATRLLASALAGSKLTRREP